MRYNMHIKNGLSDIMYFVIIWRWRSGYFWYLEQDMSQVQEFDTIVIVYCEVLDLSLICIVYEFVLLLLSLHNCFFCIEKECNEWKNDIYFVYYM